MAPGHYFLQLVLFAKKIYEDKKRRHCIHTRRQGPRQNGESGQGYSAKRARGGRGYQHEKEAPASDSLEPERSGDRQGDATPSISRDGDRPIEQKTGARRQEARQRFI